MQRESLYSTTAYYTSVNLFCDRTYTSCPSNYLPLSLSLSNDNFGSDSNNITHHIIRNKIWKEINDENELFQQDCPALIFLRAILSPILYLHSSISSVKIFSFFLNTFWSIYPIITSSYLYCAVPISHSWGLVLLYTSVEYVHRKMAHLSMFNLSSMDCNNYY